MYSVGISLDERPFSIYLLLRVAHLYLGAFVFITFSGTFCKAVMKLGASVISMGSAAFVSLLKWW